MSKICQITGKKAMVGNNVSHSKRRTKRVFNINLFKKKFYWVEQEEWITLTDLRSAVEHRADGQAGRYCAWRVGLLVHEHR